MNNSRQVLMQTDNLHHDDILATISDQFRALIRNLIRGNTKKANSLAEIIKLNILRDGEKIAFQNLIEEMAQDQAIRNSFINLPSIVPGIGTVIAIGLMSVEDFFVLDQGVRLILTLYVLYGMNSEDREKIEEMVIIVLGEAYGLNLSGKESNSDAIIRKFMTAMVPQRYVNIGVNKGVRKFLQRILPFRRKSRLLPIGFGLIMSAVNAYETIVKVGQITLKYLAVERNQLMR
jgi:hypothetical protein